MRSPSIALAVMAACMFGAANAVVSLGKAQDFSVLGGSTVTNTGATLLSGDLGVSPGSAITGFPPGILVDGKEYVGGPADTAHADLSTAFTQFMMLPCGTDLSGQDLGGMLLTPGVYCFRAPGVPSASQNGILTFDAQGDVNAQFVLQVDTTYINSGVSSMLLINKANTANIFFVLGTSATIAKASSFSGNILAQASATAVGGAAIFGRLLAINGAVTLDNNRIMNPQRTPIVVTPGPGPAPGPGIKKLDCRRYTRKEPECMAINVLNNDKNCIWNAGRSAILKDLNRAKKDGDKQLVRKLYKILEECKGYAGCQRRSDCSYFPCEYLCKAISTCQWAGNGCFRKAV